jgi:quercetin dioxygenase-like cupin family protein
MAIPHAGAGDVIDIRPLGPSLPQWETHTLVKTGDMEIIRLVLPQGRDIATHSAPGQITVQCLEGRVAFTALGKTVELEPGHFLYLQANDPHSLRAEEDSSLLLTILLPRSGQHST